MADRAKQHVQKMFNRIASRYESTFAGRHSAKMKQAALARLSHEVHGSLL